MYACTQVLLDYLGFPTVANQSPAVSYQVILLLLHWKEVGSLPEFPPLVHPSIGFGSIGVTGELHCIPGGCRLIRVILLLKIHSESVTSVGIVMLLDTKAILDELPFEQTLMYMCMLRLCWTT
jgi:hypothetical protein